MSELIDRQAAIDAIRASASKYTGFMEMEMYTDDDAVKAIEAVPAASPWHRVEEPPKERNDYFAFTSDGEVKVCDYIPSVKHWWDGDDMIRNVTHWMPLPEPPKEDA